MHLFTDSSHLLSGRCLRTLLQLGIKNPGLATKKVFYCSLDSNDLNNVALYVDAASAVLAILLESESLFSLFLQIMH